MSESIPEGTGFTTSKIWREVEYKGISMLFRFDYEGDDLYLITQTEVDGVGVVTSTIVCEPVGMTAPEAGLRWLSDLGVDDFESFYQSAKQAWMVCFYGGD